ncbi:hypothetical protein MTO96_000262 [Rhipicephalus appendiculatus]
MKNIPTGQSAGHILPGVEKGKRHFEHECKTISILRRRGSREEEKSYVRRKCTRYRTLEQTEEPHRATGNGRLKPEIAAVQGHRLQASAAVPRWDSPSVRARILFSGPKKDR